MICEKNLDLIDDLVAGDLAAEIAARVNSHVSVCPKCRTHYDRLKREKEIYARYLFDAEPPRDLWANFQTRLALEKEETFNAAATPLRATIQKTRRLDFLRRFPAFAGAILLIGCGIGFGWLKFVPDAARVDQFVAETNPEKSPATNDPGAADKTETAALPAKIETGETGATARNSKSDDQIKFLKAGKAEKAGKSEKAEKAKAGKAAKNIFAVRPEAFVAGAVKNRQKTGVQNSNKNSTAENQSKADEQSLKSRLKTLETEIAGQIERVELLLRSFRNARATGTVETFDVEYEKGQARRLLGKNARLRRAAESYGIDYAEDLLGRIEPYLLDIANLESNSAPDKVLDIKERVKNQSIIASLQIY